MSCCRYTPSGRQGFAPGSQAESQGYKERAEDRFVSAEPYRDDQSTCYGNHHNQDSKDNRKDAAQREEPFTRDIPAQLHFALPVVSPDLSSLLRCLSYAKGIVRAICHGERMLPGSLLSPPLRTAAHAPAGVIVAFVECSRHRRLSMELHRGHSTGMQQNLRIVADGVLRAL
jgi:hypothetical protein